MELLSTVVSELGSDGSEVFAASAIILRLSLGQLDGGGDSVVRLSTIYWADIFKSICRNLFHASS